MRFARLIAAGLGTGFAPIAAGTVASAAATVTGGALMLVSPLALAGAALLAVVGGYLAIKRAGIEGDPKWVVIDEFAGQWITLLALPQPDVPALLLAFVLFRILDVTKLGPIGWADRQHGAFGIMADDVIAGFIGALLLTVVNQVYPLWLIRP